MDDAATQPDLFAKPFKAPQGFRYATALITESEERSLVESFHSLPFKEFEFQGFIGKRRVVSFGWRYDFNGGGFQRIEPMPDFLLPLRDKAAAFAGIAPGALEHALLTEYRPGAAIGWHKDRSVFDDVIGISLVSPCTFRFRRRRENGWERHSVTMEPRSVYLLRGPSRTEWEHSIPAVSALRYSVTFRTLNESQNC
jgi:alkylated DNA repair dioxygenase AlkB